ncbi:MAG: hypothetical protein FWG87_03605 [Defluviitaleaceae bacterium]|nr:hypothetical protein [Defluviitaleaceae bacterium]
MSENFFNNPDFIEQLKQSASHIKNRAIEENRSELDIINDKINQAGINMDMLINDSIENIKKREYSEGYEILSYLVSEPDTVVHV